MLYADVAQVGMNFLCNEYGRYANKKMENGETPVSFLSFTMGRF